MSDNTWFAIFDAIKNGSPELARGVRAALVPEFVRVLGGSPVDLARLFETHPEVLEEVSVHVFRKDYAVGGQTLLKLLPFVDSPGLLSKACDIPAGERGDETVLIDAFRRMANARTAKGLSEELWKLSGRTLLHCALAVLPHLPQAATASGSLGNLGPKLMALAVAPADRDVAPVMDLVHRESLLNEVVRIESAEFALANLPANLTDRLRDLDTLLMLADLGRCFRVEPQDCKDRLRELPQITPASGFRITRILK